MRNSRKLWTALGAGLLVAVGPSAGALAATVPSPQQGTVLPTHDGPPSAYSPNPQGGAGSLPNADASGGPQSGGRLNKAGAPAEGSPQTVPGKTTKQAPAERTPNGGQIPPSSMGNLPNRQTTPYQSQAPEQQQSSGQQSSGRQTSGQQQAPDTQQAPAKPDAGTPQDPKMPDDKDMTLPDVTAPQDGPGPVGPGAGA